eukprot:898426-Pelagomonas_calceolata.AAC.1
MCGPSHIVAVSADNAADGNDQEGGEHGGGSSSLHDTTPADDSDSSDSGSEGGEGGGGRESGSEEEEEVVVMGPGGEQRTLKAVTHSGASTGKYGSLAAASGTHGGNLEEGVGGASSTDGEEDEQGEREAGGEGTGSKEPHNRMGSSDEQGQEEGEEGAPGEDLQNFESVLPGPVAPAELAAVIEEVLGCHQPPGVRVRDIASRPHVRYVTFTDIMPPRPQTQKHINVHVYYNDNIIILLYVIIVIGTSRAGHMRVPYPPVCVLGPLCASDCTHISAVLKKHQGRLAARSFSLIIMSVSFTSLTGVMAGGTQNYGRRCRAAQPLLLYRMRFPSIKAEQCLKHAHQCPSVCTNMGVFVGKEEALELAVMLWREGFVNTVPASSNKLQPAKQLQQTHKKGHLGGILKGIQHSKQVSCEERRSMYRQPITLRQ